MIFKGGIFKMIEKAFFKREMTPEQASKFKNGFGERLKTLRKKKNESQENISRELGLGNCTYGTYENERYLPDAVTLRDLAVYFGVSADYLLGLIDEPNHTDEELPMPVNFFHECKYDIERIRVDRKSEKTFKYLLHEKEFLDFLLYINTYLTYAVKFSREEKKRMYENPDFVRAVRVDVSETSVDTDSLPDKGIAIENIYLHLLHEKLNDLLRNIIREHEDDLKEVFKKNVKIYISEQKEKNRRY